MFSFLRQNWRVFLLSFLLYIVWVAYWAIKANVLFTGSAFWDIHFPERVAPDPFTVSYAASAMDSLIFFMTVTFVITLLSAKKPEEENLDRKIEYIFAGADAKSKLGQYLANEVSSLACISTMTHRCITLVDSDVNHDILKMHTNSDVQIKNIHNNHMYATDEMVFNVKADVLEDVGDQLGEVLDISMLLDSADTSRNRRIIDQPAQLNKQNNTFTREFSLKLQPNEQVIYRSSMWLYQHIVEPLKIGTPRYTLVHKIELKNESSSAVKLSVRAPSADSSEGTTKTETFILEKGDNVSLDYTNLTPAEIVEINFSRIQSGAEAQDVEPAITDETSGSD